MREDYRERFRILGLRIAYYRKMRGMTQEQFAEAIGRSVSFVSQIEARNALSHERKARHFHGAAL